ncbi:MAG: PadR family transcriptional regulator [Candidatus Bathyarchaeota archaeon]|jgi:DNA-binding PadR family transcriptional regulator|nr:PadR family transcriptional regulator [Candidatus Bathyarchaeota archaeon]
MSETFKKEIVEHIIKNLLDVQLLRIVQSQPTWGYRIKKQVEEDFNIVLRHGALYPALNGLEAKGLLASTRERKNGRSRKVYTITDSGRVYLRTFYSVMQGQMDCAERGV